MKLIMKINNSIIEIYENNGKLFEIDAESDSTKELDKLLDYILDNFDIKNSLDIVLKEENKNVDSVIYKIADSIKNKLIDEYKDIVNNIKNNN